MTELLAAIIPAHTAASVLGPTLAYLRAAVPPPERIIVIADHCTDSTALVAKQGGAVALRRDEGEAGKGLALRWLFERQPSLLESTSQCVILDADSQVHPACFAELRRVFSSGDLWTNPPSFVAGVELTSSSPI